LSWPEDNQQQPVPAIVIADGGEQQQLGLLVSLSLSGKMRLNQRDSMSLGKKLMFLPLLLLI
jgi:hypothetical protein